MRYRQYKRDVQQMTKPFNGWSVNNMTRIQACMQVVNANIVANNRHYYVDHVMAAKEGLLPASCGHCGASVNVDLDALSKDYKAFVCAHCLEYENVSPKMVAKRIVEWINRLKLDIRNNMLLQKVFVDFLNDDMGDT